jgi:hypothetical protein
VLIDLATHGLFTEGIDDCSVVVDLGAPLVRQHPTAPARMASIGTAAEAG